MRILKRVLTVFLIFFILVLMGCSKKGANELNKSDLEEYKNYFKKFEVIQPEKSISSLADEWKENILLFVAEFIQGGVDTYSGLKYPGDDYGQGSFEYCLMDFDNDGICEFLLAYRCSDDDVPDWEVYNTGAGSEIEYVGKAKYYDRDEKMLIDGYKAYYLNGYKYKAGKLETALQYYSYYYEEEQTEDDFPDRKYHYYLVDNGEESELSIEDYENQISDYIASNEPIKGKALKLSDLAQDLELDLNDSVLKEKIIYREYYGVLKYMQKNDSDMTAYKYSFFDIDGDEIPEMIASGDNKVILFYYLDGKINLITESVEYEGYRKKCVFYPGKNIFNVLDAENGKVKESYYSLRNYETQCVLAIEQEPIDTLYKNDYERTLQGKIRYNYFLDGVAVSEHDCDEVRKILFDTLELTDGVSLADMEKIDYSKALEVLKTM